MSDNPYNLQTKAGQRLWQHFNNIYGSSVWGPLGRGIEEVEAEMITNIINTLEQMRIDNYEHEEVIGYNSGWDMGIHDVIDLLHDLKDKK